MALHPNFPQSPYTIFDPALRWFPADEALRESSSEKLMPPLVSHRDASPPAQHDSLGTQSCVPMSCGPI